MNCVDCGGPNPVEEGSCRPCFAARQELFQAPAELALEFCSHCGARHDGSHWHDTELPANLARQEAERAAILLHRLAKASEINLEERTRDERTHLVTIQATATILGISLAQTSTMLVRVRQGVCDRCSRIVGGYWAALIQLRATERTVSPAELKRAHKLVGDTLAAALQGGNRFAFLQKEGAMHGGWDYYIGDIEGARQCSREAAGRLGARVFESAKLIGRREGRDVYRVTFLVRISPFAPGDMAILGEELLRVVKTDRGFVRAIRMVDHRATKVPESGLRRLGGQEVIEEAVVVSSDDHNVQVLEPKTMRPMDLPRPDGCHIGETVYVFRHEEQLWLVPALR